jgi:hypothetical protein
VIDLVIVCDLQDGNDALEASVTLPAIPSKGDVIGFWIPSQYPSGGGHEEFPTVELVEFSAWAPDNIRVYVRFDGYDADAIRDVMHNPGRQP